MAHYQSVCSELCNSNIISMHYDLLQYTYVSQNINVVKYIYIWQILIFWNQDTCEIGTSLFCKVQTQVTHNTTIQ